MLAATTQAANQVGESLQANGFAWLKVVESLQANGFAWLKISRSEKRSFHQFQQYISEPDSCFEQASMVLSDKRLVQYNPGSMTLPPPGCAAADKVSPSDLQYV